MAAGKGGGAMRLCERTLMQAELAPRMDARGSLGGLAERFSDEGIAFRASRLPADGDLTAREKGVSAREKVRLLAAVDVPAKAGDGVRMEDRMYRIVSVQRWTAHVELICEAI